MFLTLGLGIGRTAAGFNPPRAAELVAWYDASDAASITLGTGSAIAQCSDRSGNGNHLVQTTEASRPELLTAAQNGRDAVRFTGASTQRFDLTSPIVTDAFTCISVKRRGGPTGANQVILFGAVDTATCWWVSGGSILVFGNEQQYFTSAAVPTSNYAQVTVAKSLNFALCRVDGAQKAMTGPNALVGLGNTFTLFGQTAANYCNGEVAEVLLWAHGSSVLDASEIQQVEAYLKAKWGTP